MKIATVRISYRIGEPIYIRVSEWSNDVYEDCKDQVNVSTIRCVMDKSGANIKSLESTGWVGSNEFQNKQRKDIVNACVAKLLEKIELDFEEIKTKTERTKEVLHRIVEGIV